MSIIKILYLRDKNFQPVGCVAYTRTTDGLSTDRVSYELSVRNPRDALDAKGRTVGFNRTRAREIAIGRLHTHPISVLIASELTGELASDAILADIADRSPVFGVSQVSDRARKAARAMLARVATSLENAIETVETVESVASSGRSPVTQRNDGQNGNALASLTVGDFLGILDGE